MKFSLVLLLILISFGCLGENGTLLPTKKGLYEIEGFKLYIECYENDKPKLILEQGFGRSGSDGAWMKNVTKLSKSFSICLYDRSGLGKSEKGPIPFTLFDTASWLHTLLSKADVKPPYYFAGGSYSSYIIRAYNNLYTNEVLGAVLIDPPPFGYFYTMATRWPADFHTNNEKLKRMMNFELGVKDPMFGKVPENVDHLKSYELITSSKTFENKPLIVLFSQTKKRYINKTEKYDAPFVPENIAKVMDVLFSNIELSFKALSSNTKIIYSKSDRHGLHLADPDLVVSNIESLLTGN